MTKEPEVVRVKVVHEKRAEPEFTQVRTGKAPFEYDFVPVTREEFFQK